MPSKNFRNPFGLVYRMLASGQRAAYGALFREALRVGAIPMDAILKRSEQRRLTHTDDVVSQHPHLFVVGAPRGGTTLVYQVLSRYLDVSYPTNLSALFPRSPITATRIFGWALRQKTADFHNYYGQTSRLSGPNDAFFLWDRWLGDDRYNAAAALSESTVKDMRQFFATWCQTFGKPFLNKNNRNTTCIGLLSSSLPRAYFLVVRRNPRFVAQSLIRSRLEVQGDKSVGWGLRSQETHRDSDSLAYVDDVCEQVIRIEDELTCGLRAVDPLRVVELSYEEFCCDPAAVLNRIVACVDGVELKVRLIESELRPFRRSKSLELSSEECERIESHFDEIL